MLFIAHPEKVTNCNKIGHSLPTVYSAGNEKHNPPTPWKLGQKSWEYIRGHWIPWPASLTTDLLRIQEATELEGCSPDYK